MSGAETAQLPIGWGCTWPQLLRHLWITAAISGAFIFLCALLSYLSRFRICRRARVPAHPFFSLGEPRRLLGERGELFCELFHVAMCLSQFVFYAVLTYQGAPTRANSGVIVVSGVLLCYFALYGFARAWEESRASLVAHALTFEAHFDLAATTALWLPFLPYVDSWFSFSALRLAALSIRQQRGGTYSSRFACPQLGSFLFSAVLNFFCFIAVMASVVTTLERAGTPAGWGAATQGDWAFTGAIYWAIITVTTIGYGDIVPASLLGRYATNLFVILALVLVAAISTRLLALLEKERAGGGSFSPPAGKACVLLIAPCASAQDLLSTLEGLLASQRRRYLHVVALLADPQRGPTARELAALRLRADVTVLRGSVFSGRDLQRASAARCEAAIVLQGPGCDDGENLMALFALRAALPSTPLLAAVASHASACFALTAVARESLLVLDAARLGLLAQNALCAGVLQLVLSWLPGAGSPNPGAGAAAARGEQQPSGAPPRALGPPRRPPSPLGARPTPLELARFVLFSVEGAALGAPPPPPPPPPRQQQQQQQQHENPRAHPSHLLEVRVPACALKFDGRPHKTGALDAVRPPSLFQAPPSPQPTRFAPPPSPYPRRGRWPHARGAFGPRIPRAGAGGGLRGG